MSNGEPERAVARRPRAKHAGFTYLAMLFAVATAGAVAATGSVVWSHEAQRERERELVRIGAEFKRAIGLYYESSPGSVRKYPEKLEDLVLDLRHLSLQRYLRRIYRDPMTGKQEWGLVEAPTGGIIGVHSLSDKTPIGRHEPAADQKPPEGRGSYADWKFVYVPPEQPALAPRPR